MRERILSLRNRSDLGNDKCADCGAADPEWASTNLGVFICVHCCGVHRHLGTHLSRIKSVKLDAWSEDTILKMENKGNFRVNSHYAGKVPAPWRRIAKGDPNYLREQWIRAKYERKEFCPNFEKQEIIPVKGGFLWKKGKQSNKWAQRFFMLSGQQLVYYKSPDNITKPLGVIFLSGAKIILADDLVNRRFCIQITDVSNTEDSERNYFLAADDGYELYTWINILRFAKADALLLTDYDKLGPISPFPNESNIEYERQLGCEVIKIGTIWKLDVSTSDNYSKSRMGLTSKFTSILNNKSTTQLHDRWIQYHVVLDWDTLRFYKEPSSPYPILTITFLSRNSGIQVIPIDSNTLKDESRKMSRSSSSSNGGSESKDDILQVLGQMKPPPTSSYAFVVKWPSDVYCAFRSSNGDLISSSRKNHAGTGFTEEDFMNSSAAAYLTPPSTPVHDPITMASKKSSCVCFFASESSSSREAWVSDFRKLED